MIRALCRIIRRQKPVRKGVECLVHCFDFNPTRPTTGARDQWTQDQLAAVCRLEGDTDAAQ
jgi:hypothetical protein